MIKYIDELASFNSATLNQLESDLVIKGQPDRELATIHSMCEIHLAQIQQQAHNRVRTLRIDCILFHNHFNDNDLFFSLFF